jgi:hypothetical protein
MKAVVVGGTGATGTTASVMNGTGIPVGLLKFDRQGVAVVAFRASGFWKFKYPSNVAGSGAKQSLLCTGRELVGQLLENPRWETVVSLARREIDLSETYKVHEVCVRCQ